MILKLKKSEVLIEKNIKKSIIDNDEFELKCQIIKLMELFLKDKSSVNVLGVLSSYYITIPVVLGRSNYFIFKDENLEEVFVELSGIDQYSKDDAKKIVKKLLKFISNTSRTEKIRNENKKLRDIGFLLINDFDNNVMKKYLDLKKLDFTIESLKEVDKYLENLRKNKLSEEDIKKVILRCGSYLGEVIRKKNSERFIWISYKEASEIYEAGKLPLEDDLTSTFILYDKTNERFWFPINKVYKFIESGKADNLWAFATICLKYNKKLK